MNPENSGAEHVDFRASGENPYSAIGAPSAGLDKDPRFQAIRAELVNAWEKTNDKPILSSQGQDYLFGDASSYQRGQEPVSIQKRVEAVFRERFPENFQAYEQKEKTRVYDDPSQDPAVRAVEVKITEAVNKDVNEARTGRYARIAANDHQLWDRMWIAESTSAWGAFAILYPEKAAAYRNRISFIDRALDRHAPQEAKPAVRVIETPKVPETPTDMALETVAQTHYEHVTQKNTEIVVERERLEVLPYVKGNILADLTVPEPQTAEQVVDTKLVAGSVQFSFNSWSGNPDEKDERNGLIETIATDFIADAKSRSDKSVRRAFDTRGTLSVTLGRVEGPEGPMYIAKDGSHRIAAAKLAEMPKVLAKVENWRECRTVKTKSASQAEWWNKLIERGLMVGAIETNNGESVLTIERQVLPWCTASQSEFLKSSLAYYHLYPETFKKMKSLKDGKPLPEAIFLDKSGYFLNLFLYRPKEFATQVKNRE